MKKLYDKLTELGYVVSDVESKTPNSGFSFDVNGNRVHVTDEVLEENLDGVVNNIKYEIDKKEKTKTVIETLKALVQDLDKINNVVFNEHDGMIAIGNVFISINDYDSDGITAHIFVDLISQGKITARKYEDLLEGIKSYLNGDNKLDEIGSELVDYLKLDDYEIDDSMIKITLPNNRKMKIGHEHENSYDIVYQTKNNIYENNEVASVVDTWSHTNIETDSVKNLAKIIVLKFIYNF